MVTTNQLACGINGYCFLKHPVGNCHSRVCNKEGMTQITKIDHTQNGWTFEVWLNQDVVIICVILNPTLP